LQKAKGSFINDKLPFLLTRIYVVDTEKYQIVKKNNKDVLKGTVESALSKPPRTIETLKGELLVQFSDISYHHDKKEYCLEIDYFLPDNLNEPILKKRSDKFRVYARKPADRKKISKKNTTKTTSKKENKRKRDEVEEKNLEVGSNKIRKVDSFKDFSVKLEELFSFSNSFQEEEKKKAIELIFNKLTVLDPFFLVNSFLTNYPVQNTNAQNFQPPQIYSFI
jgi:hypothetical protein